MSDASSEHESGLGGADERSHDRSTIVFPYADLDTAIEVARAVYNRAGRGSCELDGIAAELGQTISGAFRIKTGAAKTFGLTDKDGRDSSKLSALGIRIVSSDEERAARVDAFLNVPLYQAIYDRYRGALLPPHKALEREMASFGVAPKVADRARQVFERSARQSGFFDSGENRLVRPKIENGGRSNETGEGQIDKPVNERAQDTDKAPNIPDANAGNYHPFIEGLLKTLPPTGENWPVKDRAKWLKLAANAFDLIYEGEGEIEIKVAAQTA